MRTNGRKCDLVPENLNEAAETIALISILEIGLREIQVGDAKPVAEVVRRLRDPKTDE